MQPDHSKISNGQFILAWIRSLKKLEKKLMPICRNNQTLMHVAATVERHSKYQLRSNLFP